MEAYILAGGKSRRMGTDKGLLQINNKPMAQHVADALNEAGCSAVTIITKNPLYLSLGYNTLPDLMPDLGPIGGLLTALRQSGSDFFWLLSCDTPFVTSTLLHKIMLRALQSQKSTVASCNGKLEPLVSVYHKSILPDVLNAIQHQHYSMHALLAQIVYDVAYFEASYEKLFQNLNTRADLEQSLGMDIF